MKRLRPRRHKCPTACRCLCHDMLGGPVHPGEPCPGKRGDLDASDDWTFG